MTISTENRLIYPNRAVITLTEQSNVGVVPTQRNKPGYTTGIQYTMEIPSEAIHEKNLWCNTGKSDITLWSEQYLDITLQG